MTTTGPAPAAVRRAAILDEAVALFRARGYHGTSMSDIAAAVGVQKPTLYHYYDSKQAILAAIHDRVMTELTDCLPADSDGVGGDVLVERLVARLVNFIHDRRADVEVSIRERRILDDGPWRVTNEERGRFADMIRAAVADGQRRHQFREDLDPGVAKQAIVGACSWMFQWYDPEGPWPPGEVAAELQKLLLGGLLARPARAAHASRRVA